MNNTWYIRTTTGDLKGPYTSQLAAEHAQLTLCIEGVVVAGTEDGKQILLG